MRNDKVLAHIESLWKTYIKQPLLQVNKDQALVLSTAQILINDHGSAPGMWIEKDGVVFCVLTWCSFRDEGYC